MPRPRRFAPPAARRREFATSSSGFAPEATSRPEGVEQVSAAVTEMDSVMQRGAGSSKEAAAATQELGAHAEGLSGVVGQVSVLVGA